MYGEISYDCSSAGAATAGCGVGAACGAGAGTTATGAATALGGAGGAAGTTTATSAAGAVVCACGATLHTNRLCEQRRAGACTSMHPHTDLAAATGGRAAAARSSSARALLSSTCAGEGQRPPKFKNMMMRTLRLASSARSSFSSASRRCASVSCWCACTTKVRRGGRARAPQHTHLHRLLQPRWQHRRGAFAGSWQRSTACRRWRHG